MTTDTENLYTIRTDAVSYEVFAADPEEALDRAVEEGDWAKHGSDREARDVRNGAWLTIFDAEGVPVLRRGTMP